MRFAYGRIWRTESSIDPAIPRENRYRFFLAFFRSSRGSGPVVHSEPPGLTGSGGPGNRGVHGGLGKRYGRLRSRGALPRLLFAI